MGAFFLSVTKYKLNILLRALVHLGNNFVFSNHDHKTVIVLISLICYVCFGEMMSWHFTILSQLGQLIQIESFFRSHLHLMHKLYTSIYIFLLVNLSFYAYDAVTFRHNTSHVKIGFSWVKVDLTHEKFIVGNGPFHQMVMDMQIILYVHKQYS